MYTVYSLQCWLLQSARIWVCGMTLLQLLTWLKPNKKQSRTAIVVHDVEVVLRPPVIWVDTATYFWKYVFFAVCIFLFSLHCNFLPSGMHTLKQYFQHWSSVLDSRYWPRYPKLPNWYPKPYVDDFSKSSQSILCTLITGISLTLG